MLLHRHCTFDTTEIDRLITKTAHINTSLNVHSFCTKIQGNVYVLSSVRRVSLIVYVANLEVNWYCENDLLNCASEFIGAIFV